MGAGMVRTNCEYFGGFGEAPGVVGTDFNCGRGHDLCFFDVYFFKS
jgi:hypothetical protein